jgi:hypothetical protein
MRANRIILSLVLVVFLVGGVSMTGAQSQEPYPVGDISIEYKQVSAGVGYSWGDGVLKFKGKEYKFKVKGLKAIAVGISSIKAKGLVYSLENVSDFPGNYLSWEAGAALIKGPAGLVMRNPKGVLIAFQASQTGVELNMGVEGINITME